MATTSKLTPMARYVRQQCGSIKSFAAAIGCSPAKAGMICQGRHIRVQTPDDVRQIATALDTSYQNVVRLLSLSYRAWSGHEPPAGWISFDPAKPDLFEQVQWRHPLEIAETGR